MKKLLIVDDSHIIHTLCRQLLGRIQGISLDFASNGAEALSTIEEHGEPSLILLDVNMPVMDGLECLRHLSERGISQRVPVAMISTEGQEDDIRRGLAAGASAYLRKPFKFQELRGLVERLLG